MILFGKRPQHMQYNYRPRYYNAEKEELQQRVERSKAAKEGDTEALRVRISEGMRRRKTGGMSVYSTARRQSNFTLLILIGVLCVAFYFLAMSVLPLLETVL